MAELERSTPQGCLAAAARVTARSAIGNAWSGARSMTFAGRAAAGEVESYTGYPPYCSSLTCSSHVAAVPSRRS